jgi:GrpB-like predicted nucleotidyltransferase (UPF0157 family)
LSEPVVIVNYDPAWPGRFESLRDRIAPAVGALAAAIEHVGSTAVPGLAAKPVIDLIVRLAAQDDLPEVIERLAGLGYRHEGDFGVTGREAFATPPGFAVHDHHLYVCAPDWAGYGDQLVFRDYLRAHPDAAAAYAALKRSLADRFRDDRAAYTNGKADYVRSILARARTR